MRLVVIESPWQDGKPPNATYLRFCILDSLHRGEAGFASHRMYTDALRDSLPNERKLGMEAGFAWLAKAELSAVYTDFGVTVGMEDGIKRASAAGIPVEMRTLDSELVALIKNSAEPVGSRLRYEAKSALAKWRFR